MANGSGRSDVSGVGQAAGVQGDLWGEVAFPDGSGRVDEQGDGGPRDCYDIPGTDCGIALCGCRFIRTGSW